MRGKAEDKEKRKAEMKRLGGRRLEGMASEHRGGKL